MSDSARTVLEVLKAGADYLAGKRVENSRLVCELLAARLLACKRLDLYLRFSHVLSEEQVEAMRRGVKRVGTGEPVQYVTGQADFMGHAFKIDARALIPRPETEVLVNRVIECESVWRNERPLIVDVGTGSGCIVISLALDAPDAVYVGVDSAGEAVELAKENAALLKVADKIAFTDADLSDFIDPGTVDALVANLPYIPVREYEKLPAHIRDHEPRSALDGGPDGLSAIRDLAGDAGIVLKPGGAMFLEIGEDQADAVGTILRESGFDEVGVTQDLAGRDRVVSGILSC